VLVDLFIIEILPASLASLILTSLADAEKLIPRNKSNNKEQVAFCFHGLFDFVITKIN